MTAPAGRGTGWEAVEAVAAALGEGAGRPLLRAAVEAAFAAVGAPTRPGAVAGSLGERWATGQPLCEDTDWRAPLGPWRDRTVLAGTVREVAAARLVDGRFGADVLADVIVASAASLPALASVLDAIDGRDEAERRAARRGAVRDAVLGPLGEVGLAGLLPRR